MVPWSNPRPTRLVAHVCGCCWATCTAMNRCIKECRCRVASGSRLPQRQLRRMSLDACKSGGCQALSQMSHVGAIQLPAWHLLLQPPPYSVTRPLVPSGAMAPVNSRLMIHRQTHFLLTMRSRLTTPLHSPVPSVQHQRCRLVLALKHSPLPTNPHHPPLPLQST